jgi:error-prone DNA polymerase
VPARPAYAELHAHSAFTFLDGADQPSDLVGQAGELGLGALAVLDVDGMYSTVQVAMAGRETGLPIVSGAELTLARGQFGAGSQDPGWGLARGAEDPGIRLPVLATSPSGYRDLCAAMSRHALDRPGERRAAHLLDELASGRGRHADWLALTGTARGPVRRALRAGGSQGLDAARRALAHLTDRLGRDRVALESALSPTDPPALADALADLAHEARIPLVATTAARCATPASGPMSDVLAATRMNASLLQAEPHLPALRSFLRSAEEMLALHRAHPEGVDAAASIGAQAAFDLRLVAPHLPGTDVPAGFTETTWLRELTRRGALARYGTREEDPEAWRAIDHELDVIEQRGFPGYFLIVREIVDFCASRRILCQGRGSAANSAVCYSLGITAVDAVRHHLMFERFLSPGRSGPPDIDLDIEAVRREEVIQHVYQRYGRDRAAQVATVISYRPRSAVRDAARALGYAPGVAQAWAKGTPRHPGNRDGEAPSPQEEGASPERVRAIAEALQRLPRHMSIHSGGMVLTEEPVSEICPVMWAATEGRSVLQWDKDDCADAGLVKFDLLGLGTLTALRRAFDWLGADGVRGTDGEAPGLHNLDRDAADTRVYELLCAADTVGVFQVESRAQMNTLPRLRPREFYDIVVEVALIRPGPIQGHAVNPYLRRRRGREEVSYLDDLLRPALKKTLGVPLFQEQLMQIAVDAAGFTPAQADRLRRAIGSKRSPERMAALRPLLLAGMAAHGIAEDVAEDVYRQLLGFADFGFPESHAFSFAHIVYASAWLKVHHPEHFYAGILASQPMGFYSPATVVQDAIRHGIAVAGPDVSDSEVEACPRPRSASLPRSGPWQGSEGASAGWSCGDAESGLPAGATRLDAHPGTVVRLGLEAVRGLGEAARRIVDARRAGGPFQSLADLASRARLSAGDMEALARSGAVESLGVSRREALWAAEAVAQGSWIQPFLPGTEVGAGAPELEPMTELETLREDYRSMGLTTGAHPFEMARPALRGRGVLTVRELGTRGDGEIVSVAGIVTHRQHPPTARGTTFLSLEDETGLANITCSKGLWTRYRRVAMTAQALEVRGRLERGDGVVNVIALRLEEVALPVAVRSRDFR